MAFMAMLILAYGPLQWSFPWWVWTLSFFVSSAPVVRNKVQVVSK